MKPARLVTLRSPRLSARRFLISLLILACLPWPISAADDLFVIGVFPRRDAKTTMTMFSPLAAYLQERLDRPVKLVTTRDFSSFWEGVTAQAYDLVHFNQRHYVEANADHGYQVVTSNEEFGQETLAGALYVRKDSGITSIQQLRGKKIVFGGGKKAMMSYVVPRFMLLQAGLGSGDFVEEFAISPPNAVLAVYYRQAVAGGAGDVVISLPQVRDRIDAGQVTMLARSKPIKGLPWATKKSLPESSRQRIKELLLTLNDTPAGKGVLSKAGLTGMVAASDKDFAPHRSYIKAVFGD